MSILSLFVVIPALMLLCLWLAKSLNQVRGVMVTGASCLLALSVWLTIYFLQQRAAGNTAEMHALVQAAEHRLFGWCRWYFRRDAAPVEYHRIHGNLRLLAVEATHQGVFPLVHAVEHRCLWLLHLNRPLHDVYVLRGGPDSDVPVDWCLG